ncbi:MAG: hypothetical protein AB1305_04315 [Candidatus Hadarchaeota archaeon]
MAGLRQEERGVSDILAIAFMLLIMVFAGTLLHAYRLDAVVSAADRQLQLKAEYLYRTLELGQVENYSLTYFSAVAENLLGLGETVVPENYLRARIDNILAYLAPQDHKVMVQLTKDNLSWTQSYAGQPGAIQFTFSGTVTIIVAEAGENRVAKVNARVVVGR